MKPFMQQTQPQESTEAEPAQAVEEPENQAGAQPKFKTAVNKALPPDLQQPFERVVLAGQKLMYSEQMQPEIQKMLSDPKPIEQKLPEGIRGVMGALSQQAKNMPPQVIIPAGIELLHDAADFLQQSGAAQITPEQMTDATQYLVVLLAKGAGASDEQIMGMFGGKAGQPAQPPVEQPGAQPAMPQQQGPMGA